MKLREVAVDIFLRSISSVHPSVLIPEAVSLDGKILRVYNTEFKIPQKIYVFGSGKASVEMAKAVEKVLGSVIKGGVVVCNYYEKLEKIDVIEGSHPIPSEKSLKAGEILLNELSKLRNDDFFIFLLSGGSSALIEKPIPPITVEDLQKTTQLLLEKSIPIEEINIVRKHLSMIKGGRLGAATKGKGVVLIISDVIDDDLFTIGSAPLYYDKSTYKDAYQILKRYNLFDKIPTTVREVILKGINGEINDTPKSENPNITHIIIGSNLKALSKCKKFAEELGFNSYIFTSMMKGESREVAHLISAIGLEVCKRENPVKKPACILFGGETTVNVKGTGKGGRNQELVLSALSDIKDTEDIVILSGGTDGIDGNTDAAGAFADSEVYKTAVEKNLNLNSYLNNNDSYNFFKETNSLIFTGKTGTNVMDITILLVGKKDDVNPS
ncbi:glycerate kinase type-2 family protein [Persephonella sp.]